MAVNLLDLVKQGLPSNFADMAGKFLGESPGATQTALSSAPACAARQHRAARIDAEGRAGAPVAAQQSGGEHRGAPAISEASFPAAASRATSMVATGSGLLSSLLGDRSRRTR